MLNVAIFSWQKDRYYNLKSLKKVGLVFDISLARIQVVHDSKYFIQYVVNTYSSYRSQFLGHNYQKYRAHHPSLIIDTYIQAKVLAENTSIQVRFKLIA